MASTRRRSLLLWRALRRGEIEFHYQPKISLATGETLAAEALARWRRPGRGLVAPGQWLPAMETPWLERQFLCYGLDAVFGQAAAWRRAGWHLQTTMNIGPRALADPQLPGLVREALERHRLRPSAVALELTEQALDFSPAAVATAEELHSLGIALALDDFGIGHSSMERLVRLPIQHLKIDRRFVTGLPGATREAAVVAAAITLCDRLGMTSVAEGIETHESLTELRRLGCDRAQGYFISPPLPVAELERWMQSRRTGSPLRRERARAGN